MHDGWLLLATASLSYWLVIGYAAVSSGIEGQTPEKTRQLTFKRNHIRQLVLVWSLIVVTCAIIELVLLPHVKVSLVINGLMAGLLVLALIVVTMAKAVSFTGFIDHRTGCLVNNYGWRRWFFGVILSGLLLNNLWPFFN